jgi:hypothetical protein
MKVELATRSRFAAWIGVVSAVVVKPCREVVTCALRHGEMASLWEGFDILVCAGLLVWGQVVQCT